MKWIDSNDLKVWAPTRDCQENLPLLIRYLIRASISSITKMRFPSGNNIWISGWDGILETQETSTFIPSGVSLWELGAEKRYKKKAETDLSKRTNDPKGWEPSMSTFVFVTPYIWPDKEEWSRKKINETVWKDIQVIDGEDLEEWIDEIPSIGAWLGSLLGKIPIDGFFSTRDFWNIWSRSSDGKFQINPELVIGGRKDVQNRIINFLQSGEQILPIKSFSMDESLAFILASTIGTELEEYFFSKSILICDQDSFIKISQSRKSQIIIPRFSEFENLGHAIQNNHQVIIPLDPDSPRNWDGCVALNRSNRDVFVKGLVKMGLSYEQARRYSKESARNMKILRRQLRFEAIVPEWARPDNYQSIIPALLVGRWNEESDSDRLILEGISETKYEKYINILSRWTHHKDIPVLRIGSCWRLTSPLDAWLNVGYRLVDNDYKILKQVSLTILGEKDPILELPPDDRKYSLFKGIKPKYSNWIREGLSQSLILIGVFGKQFELRLPNDPQQFVDNIIWELLSSKDKVLWKSLDHIMPLISEASPDSFLNAIEFHIGEKDSPIVDLFEGYDDFLSPKYYHTGLLWALENIAWIPEYLSRVTVILGELAGKCPEVKILNKPINSLSEIFKAWHPQTFANVDQRVGALNHLIKRNRNIAWELLKRLVHQKGDVATGTNKMRWRHSDQEYERNILNSDIFKFYQIITSLLIDLSENDEDKIAFLIGASQNMIYEDRKKVLEYLITNKAKIKQTTYKPWHELRVILHNHRSCPDAEWAISEIELNDYEELYYIFSPTDEYHQNIWLFNEHWPRFKDGFRSGNDYLEHDKLILEHRKEALNKLIRIRSLGNLLKEISDLKEPATFGDTAAYIITEENDIFQFIELIRIEDQASKTIASSFISRKYALLGLTSLKSILEYAIQKEFSDYHMTTILLSVRPSKDLYIFLSSLKAEINQIYWETVNPYSLYIEVDSIDILIENMLRYRRFISLIISIKYHIDIIQTGILIKILEITASEKSNDTEKYWFQSHEIENIFQALDSREDIDKSKMIQLEWWYLPFLATYGSIRKPKYLHEELINNPKFFVEIISWIYKEESEDDSEEPSELVKQSVVSRALNAKYLLESLILIPGVNSDKIIDARRLNWWIETARNESRGINREKITDYHIGILLSMFPEGDEQWPPDEICEIIDSINTKDLRSGFYIGTLNKRNTTTRSPFDGGKIEYELENYFVRLSEKIGDKYPISAQILRLIAKQYTERGKNEDHRAERDDLDN